MKHHWQLISFSMLDNFATDAIGRQSMWCGIIDTQRRIDAVFAVGRMDGG
jgi:hypothetical protein